MQALVWDERHGREVAPRRRSPPSWPPRPSEARHQLIDILSNFDDAITEKFLGDEEITADDLRRALRRATIASQVVPVLCGSAFKNKGVQPMLDAVVDYLPSPLDIPPTAGMDHEGRGARARARRRRAVLRPGLQDHDRPLRGQAHLHPGLLGHLDQGRPPSLNSTKDRKERVGPHPPDARQPPRGQGRHLHRRHRGRGRASSRPPPATPCATRPPDRARGARVPGAGDPRGRRAQDQGRPGQAVQGPLRAVRGGPHLPGPHRRGDGPDGHLGHGRAPPRGARRPDAAGVPGGRQRGQAPGGLPRDHPQEGGEGRGPLRPPDRRPGPVRPRGHQPGAHRPRRRLRVRRQDHRRGHPQGVHPRRRRRHPGGAHATGSWPGTPWSTSGSP